MYFFLLNKAMNRQFSSACERNREPILSVLHQVLPHDAHVLEIGSGTGQHAVYFGREMPHLRWQTSDRPSYHASIRAWIDDAGLPNVLPPLALDVAVDDWPQGPYDAVFSANTCHIMAWNEVQTMFAGIGRVLAENGIVCIYGPFNQGGQFTSASNAAFDASLKAQAAHMGIRDVEAVSQLAAEQGLKLLADYAMPANNRLLVWRRSEC
jgi:cyclopropane fatty-acyl-phospholipid synthase-like methyltransferase